MRRCMAVNPEGFESLLLGFSVDVFYFGFHTLISVVDELDWGQEKERKETSGLCAMYALCANATHLISFIFKMCNLSALALLFHCLLFHSRSTKGTLISHSGCSCLMKSGFVYFPFCRTRSLLGLHKCVTTSTSSQVMKASVSRQVDIWNEWAIIGKYMSMWLHQVCFLIFPLSKARMSNSKANKGQINIV